MVTRDGKDVRESGLRSGSRTSETGPVWRERGEGEGEGEELSVW